MSRHTATSNRITLGELHRQGREIKTALRELDRKMDAANAIIIRHDGEITNHAEDIGEIRADLKSRRVTTGTIAGVVATVITVVGEIIGHIH